MNIRTAVTGIRAPGCGWCGCAAGTTCGRRHADVRTRCVHVPSTRCLVSARVCVGEIGRGRVQMHRARALNRKISSGARFPRPGDKEKLHGRRTGGLAAGRDKLHGCRPVPSYCQLAAAVLTASWWHHQFRARARARRRRREYNVYGVSAAARNSIIHVLGASHAHTRTQVRTHTYIYIYIFVASEVLHSYPVYFCVYICVMPSSLLINYIINVLTATGCSSIDRGNPGWIVAGRRVKINSHTFDMECSCIVPTCPCISGRIVGTRE